MTNLKIYTSEDILSHVNQRPGEQKFGEAVQIFSTWDVLKKSPAKYVLFGIPEDIGVRANFGNAGTSEAWRVALGALCNVQNNELTRAENITILGEIDCNTQMRQASNIDENDPHFAEKLGELVTQIDHKVTEVVTSIVAAGKTPIIIGGGHNNSFGNIKGVSQALKKAINCINFDAHTDFRALEHRHSGNGFSYAFEEGFLNKYFIFGLHRNYTSQAVFDLLRKKSDCIKFNLFEEISVQESLTFSEAIKQAETHCCDSDFGLELDMDAIQSMGSSAVTPSGFSFNKARKFLSHFAALQNCSYIHICEGAPKLGGLPNQVSKAIAYLVSDVISK